ncbi:MAG TPA: hypothetical protein VIO61_04785 [Anaerolineaceae bacterium]
MPCAVPPHFARNSWRTPLDNHPGYAVTGLPVPFYSPDYWISSASRPNDFGNSGCGGSQPMALLLCQPTPSPTPLGGYMQLLM